MIDLEAVTTVEALEALCPEWSALLERDPHATPFQSPEWLLPWWKHFGRGALWILALRWQGALVGLAPFYIDTVPEENLRVLSWIGAGITDYLDLIVDPDVALPAASRAYDQLVRCRSRWDRCDLQELRTSSPLLAILPKESCLMTLSAQEACPAISLPTTVEAFWKHFPAERRRKLRRAQRYLERLGGFSVERAAAETLQECLDALFRLHRSRWEERELPGVLADPSIQVFHRAVAAGLLKRGMLRLYALRHRGAIVSVVYGFAGKKCFYAYLGGFDPALAPASPGALLIAHAIEEAIRERRSEFDFLRGRESYKYFWGAQDRMNYHLQMESSSLSTEERVSVEESNGT